MWIKVEEGRTKMRKMEKECGECRNKNEARGMWKKGGGLWRKEEESGEKMRKEEKRGGRMSKNER